MRTAGPYGQAGTLPLAAAERAAGWNDRLVAVSPTTLWVYDIATPSSPVLRATFTPTSRSTAIAAVGGGVFVFNMTGYGYVDVAADTYVETASTNLKGITSATAYGGKLHVGGPSRYAGYFRVARLDPGTAPSLTVDVQNELIADGDVSGANIADSAFDPVTEEYVVLAETERSDPYGPPTSGSSTILRYAEEGGRIVPRGAARLDHVACTTQNCMYSGSDGTGRIHAYGGRVYAVLVQGANEPLYAYRLP